MKRHILLFIFSLMALVGSCIALAVTTIERDYQLRGYVDATYDPALPFRVPHLGVNVALEQYTSTELEEHLAMMHTAHITWLRQEVSWDAIEKMPGQYEWSTWDTIFSTLAQYPELRLIAVLVNSPEWARHPLAGNDPTAPPHDPRDFARFATQFAARYRDTVDHYQIWDEPNILLGWGQLNPQPADYFALLRETYPAIHNADPNTEVLAAALAPTVETGPQNISDILYLRSLYQLGAKEYMDGVAAKPIGFDRSPEDRAVDPAILNFSRIIALREEMVKQGDARKALWASEWGWNSLPEAWSGAPSIWGNVSELERNQYTLAGLNRAEREWPWLGGMILFHWQPDAPADDPLWGFSIINTEGEPTTLWEALTDRPIPEAATNGLYHPQIPFAAYSGVWTLSQTGADIGWLNDSQLDFRFQGTDIALLARKDNYVAYLYPSIDGVAPNAVPQDANGNSYIVLTSGDLQPATELIPIARSLPNTEHTLHMIADRGWDRWAIAGYAVSSGNLYQPYERQLTIVGLTLAISVISVIVAGWNIRHVRLFQPAVVLWNSISFSWQIIISAGTSLALLAGMLFTWDDGTPHLLKRDVIQLGLSLVTAGIIYINPAFILTLAAAGTLFLIIYHRVELGLMLTLFWSPFFLFPVELYRFAFPMVEIMVLLTSAAWGFRTLATWGRIRQSAVSQYSVLPFMSLLKKLHSLDYAVGVWLLVGICSLFWAQWLPPAITELRTLLIEPVLFYVVLRTTPLDHKGLVRLVDTLLLAGLIVAVIGFVTFLNPALRITAEGGAQRLTSVYGSPNNAALFLGRCIPFALAFLLIKTDKLRRRLAFTILLVMLIAAILTQSVGGLFIGLPAAIAVTLLLAWRRRALLPLAGLGILAIAAFIIALQFPRFSRALDFNQGTNFFRIRVWQSAVNIITDYPLTGIGLDQFLYHFRGHYIRPDAEAEPGLSHPHNILLDFWVRLGIPGVFALLWIQISYWKQAYRNYQHRNASRGLYFGIVLGMMGSMVNLLAHGSVDNSVYVVDLAYVFVFLLAICTKLPNVRAIDGTDG